MAGKKPVTKSKQKETSESSWREAMKDHTFQLAMGVLLIMLSFFLLGSMLSFFINWQSDQSEVSGSFYELLTDESYKVSNVFGKMGASLSHSLVYRSFGLAALVIPLLLFRVGLLVGFGFKKKFLKQLRHTLYFIGWFPVFTAWVLGSHFPILAGGAGMQIYEILHQVLGPFGVGVLLIATLVTFIIFFFRLTSTHLIGILPKRTERTVTETNSALSEEEEINAFAAAKPLTKKVEETEKEVGFTLEIENQMEPIAPISTQTSELEIEVYEEKALETVLSSETEKVETSLEKDTNEDELELTVQETVSENELDSAAHKKLVKEMGEYDHKLDLGSFRMPGLDLMKDYGTSNIKIDQEELEVNKNRIVHTLGTYNIEIAKIKATIGPTVTLYEIVPAPGVRISKIKNLEDDIALSLSAEGIRIIAPIPGKGTIGIEVPNAKPSMVSMRTVLASEKFLHSDMQLPIVLGKTISNETYVTDLAKMPHLLMAGATGQGKSVGLNVILTSLLYKRHPSEVKFVMVDPKKVELTLFNKIERHYLATLPNNEDAIITDTRKVIYTLNSLCIEMDDRYDLLKNAMVRNIVEYNEKFKNRRLNPAEGHRHLPYIVLVVDEFADLIMTAGKEVETPIARLAQLARAIGIHLIIATQRPSVNVITGIIKANFPARIAFRVTSKIDSRTILDAGGAERLIGKGDMLISLGNEPIRLQCAFVDTPEIERLTEFIGNQRGYPTAYQLPEYEGEEGGSELDIDPSDRDALFAEAAKLVVMHQQGSASLLQRKLKLGYNRAGRLVDQLEAAGIIGPFEGSKARQVYIQDEAGLEQILKP